MPAAVTATVLLLVGAAIGVSAGGRLVTGRVDAVTVKVVDRIAGMQWNDPMVIAVCAVVFLVGLMLLLTAVLPGRRDLLNVELSGSELTGVEAVMSRRTLRTLLISRVGDVDGVDRVDADVTERQVVVQAATATRYTRDVQDDVAEAARQALSDTALSPPPRVRSSVRQHG